VYQVAVTAAVVAMGRPVVEMAVMVAAVMAEGTVKVAVAKELRAAATAATAVGEEDSGVAATAAAGSLSATAVAVELPIPGACSVGAVNSVAAMVMLVVEMEETWARTCSRFARIYVRPHTGVRHRQLAALMLE
jgi:hypothetical protein